MAWFVPKGSSTVLYIKSVIVSSKFRVSVTLNESLVYYYASSQICFSAPWRLPWTACSIRRVKVIANNYKTFIAICAVNQRWRKGSFL